MRYRVMHLLSRLISNDTATTGIYTLSLHDALPISDGRCRPGSGKPVAGLGLAPARQPVPVRARVGQITQMTEGRARCRSEEHTSELQSRLHLVCRLLLEKKK